jgi:hypothetical protein
VKGEAGWCGRSPPACRAGNQRPGGQKEQDIMTQTLTYQQMGTAARGQAHALFIAGFGAAGTRPGATLTTLARVSFRALLALIVAGIVLIFVHIPRGRSCARCSAC